MIHNQIDRQQFQRLNDLLKAAQNSLHTDPVVPETATAALRAVTSELDAVKPFEQPTGWHWHDMTAHFVYVLGGWIEFRYAGADDVVRVEAGSSLSQPAGVAHNVVGRSDDLELIEINLPAGYGTWALPVEPRGGAQP